MDLIFWGWSDIVRRRVLPAARHISQLKHICLVANSEFLESPSEAPIDDVPEVLRLPSLGPVSQFLARPENGIVYLSGINTAHGVRCIEALEFGWHVAVDKTAFISNFDCVTASAIARERSLVLREALVWSYHEQVRQLSQVLRNEELIPESLQGTFCIPGFAESNFRNSRPAGGGACCDLGPYAVTAALPFGLDDFANVSSLLLHESRVQSPDRDFVVTARVGTATTFVGSLSHKTSYLNQLTLLGSNFRAELNPAFSPPAS